MKNYLLWMVILMVQFTFATTVKDSINSFTFQKMNLLEEDFYDDCDACGCSASAGGIGFGTMLYNNFVGVRYLNQSYTSRDGIFANSPWVNENFNTVQVWAKISISKKIQLFGLLPYQDHSRERSTGKESISGIGDLTIMGMYTILETFKDSTTIVTQKFQVGGGMKFPTGEYNGANNLGNVNKSFQVGTGSFDYLLAADYVIQKNNLGLNLLMDYTFKTENDVNYKFGNQFNYGGLLFYLVDLDSFKFFPHVGLLGEVYDANEQHQLELPETAGDILFSKFGLEVGRNNFSLGASVMLPVAQNLSEGNIEANYRWSVNLNYSL